MLSAKSIQRHGAQVKSEAFHKKKTATLRAKNEVGNSAVVAVRKGTRVARQPIQHPVLEKRGYRGR